MKRYENYFGTPERVSKTMSVLIDNIDRTMDSKTDLNICDLYVSCRYCPVHNFYCNDVVSWLNEEMD